jgi:hypothetical protein
MKIDNIHKNLAKVNNGSGVIIRYSNTCYVLTAYHNIEEAISYKEPIEIKNDKNIGITIINHYYKPSKDIALFEVEFIKDTSVIKFDKNIKANDNITFIGYPEKAKGKRKRYSGYVDEWNNKTSIKVVENVNPSPIEEERANEVIVGFSGSAVFKTNINNISLIGLIRSMPEKDFYYKDINCVSIKDILCFLDENNLSILKPLKTNKNTMASKTKILNNFGRSDNSQIHTGSGNQYISIHENQKKTFQDGKKLFDIDLFSPSADIFHEAALRNPDDLRSYFYYCIAKLSSMKNISKMDTKDINCIYSFINILNKTDYKKTSIFLWLIVFYEYNEPKSKTLNLEGKENEKRKYAINSYLTEEEKNIFRKISIVTDKAKSLLSF